MKRLIVSLVFACAVPSIVNAQAVSSGSNHTYYPGDSAAQRSAGSIVVFCGSGTINATDNIELRIPSTIDLVWDTSAPSVTVAMTGSGTGGVDPAVTYSGDAKTMFIDVTTTFASTQNCTVTGARYSLTSSTPATAYLEMDHDADAAAEETDFFFIRIAGNGTISSAGQIFFVGQSAQSISTITLTDHATHPGFTTGRGIRIRIPSSGPGLDMTWQTADVIATVTPGPGTGTVSGTVSYDGTGRVLRITVTSDFSAGQTLTISDLQFTNFNSVSGPDQLELVVNGSDSGPTAATDANDKQVRGNPNLNSGDTAGAGTAPLRFTVGDPATALPTIRVTDALGVATIDTTVDIRIRIPSTFPMDFVTSVGSVTIDGTGASHILGGPGPGSIAVSYIGTKTVVIPVSSAFSPGEYVTIAGLQVQSFGSLVEPDASGAAADNLELLTTNTTTADDDDDQTVAIGAPQMLSAAAQVFLTGDGPTTIQDIVITDGGGGIPARIGIAGSGTQIRIRIPAGFDMEWNTSDTSARIQGSGASHIGGNTTGQQYTVTYATFDGAMKDLIISVISAFGPGQSITIDQLSFRGLGPGGTFVTAELPDNLELIVNDTAGTVCDYDGTSVISRTKAVGGQPSIAATGNMRYAVRDPASPLQADVVVTDASGVARIDNSTECRIRIASTFDMEWNTADTSIQITATATTAAKITGSALVSGSTYNVPVSYESNGSFANRVLVIGISTDFVPDETFTILGASLSFAFPSAGGAEAAQANVLELIVNGSPTSTPPADTDDANTIAIGAPTITFSNQIFGTGDPATPNNTITIAEDGVTPTIRAANGIRVRIPAAAALTWDTADFVATFGGSAASKVVGVSYADPNTLLISLTPVTGDFTATDTLTIDNLTFVPGVTETGPHQLDLIVSGIALTVTDTSNPGTGDLIVSNRPTIVSVVTLDTSNNGVLDQIVVTFSEDINGATASVATGAGFAFGSYTIAAGTETSAGVVTYLLVESGTPDTGATPALAYAPATGSLTDVFGLEMNAVAAFPSTDGAPPRIMGFTVSDANGDGTLDRLTFTFSEPIASGLDLGDWQIVGADGANLLPGASLTIVGSTLVFDVVVPISPAALPRYRYDPSLNANGIQLADAGGNTVLAQSNNTPPVANAGPDQSLPPTLVTLDGTASADPDGQTLTYAWAQTGGPAAVTLSSATSPTPTFLATVDGAYTFALTVSDGLVSTPDSITITIINVPPNADAGFDQTVAAGTAVTLDASRTVDVNGDTISFAWAQVSGPSAAPLSGTGATRTFTTTGLNGVWVFEVTAGDGLASGTDRVTVRVNGAGNAVPTADAGPDLVVAVGSTVTLNGTLSSDPEGAPLSFSWTSPLALTGATTATPSFTPMLPGLFTFTLVVTAAGVDSAPDSVNVLVIMPSNLPPVASAARIAPAGDAIVGGAVTLDASGSSDPEGAGLIYSWLQIAGPSALLVGPSSMQPTFVPVVAGTYVFRLVAGDGVQSSLPVEIAVPVLPSAGALPSAVTAITAADDPDGDGRVLGTAPLPVDLTGAASTPGGLAFFWEQTGGPAVPLAGVATSTPSFFPSLPGVYRFRLTVIDGAGVRDTEALTVVVDTLNQAPTANAGPDRTGAAGQPVVLDGSASFDPADADAVTDFSNGLTAFWTQVSGPAAALSDPYAASPSFVPSAAGTYVFALVVSDGVAASAPDQVVAVVSPGAGGDGGGGGSGGCGLTGFEPLLLLAVLRVRRRVP